MWNLDLCTLILVYVSDYKAPFRVVDVDIPLKLGIKQKGYRAVTLK